MAKFDPYHKWLGIRDPQRPPNHYRLLGLEAFEADAEVISMAAKRQRDHVLSFRSGPHRKAVRELLNEISTAKKCLTDTREKQKYDQRLSIELGQGFSGNETTAQVGHPEESVPPAQPFTISINDTPLIDTTDQSPFDNIDTSASPGSQSVNVRTTDREEQRRTRQRKQGSGWVTQMVGVIGGGVLAVLVAGWIIKSGYLERFRPGFEEKTEQFADKKDIEFSKPEPPKKPPTANKKSGRQPGKQPNRETTANNPSSANSRIAPWMEMRWPAIPSQLGNPLSTLDRLLQSTRIAIAQRQFNKARNEWKQVKDQARKIDASINLGMLATKSERFWKDVTKTASKLKVGDKIMFRKKAVEVVRTTQREIKLKHNQSTKSFPLDHLLLDRDLAKGLASKTGYDRTLTEKYLNLDFAHASFSSGSDSFFNPTNRRTDAANNSGSTTGNTVQPDRAPVPAPADLTAILPRIKKLFPKAYQRGLNLRDHTKQLDEMIESAEESDNIIESYALMQQVVKLSGKAGTIEPGYDAITKLAKQFEIDLWSEIQKLTKEVAGNLKNMEQATKFQDRLETLVAQSARAKDFQSAAIFAEQARENAKRKLNSREKAEDAAATEEYITKMTTLESRGKRALETLKLKPTDVSANTNAGLYLCFLIGDYETGAVRLSKSNRALLRNIGQAEEGFATSQDGEMAIATLWAQYAKGQKGFVRYAAYRRSRHWLELAYRKTKEGLQKRDLKNKMDQVDATLKNDPLDALGLMEDSDPKGRLSNRRPSFGRGQTGVGGGQNGSKRGLAQDTEYIFKTTFQFEDPKSGNFSVRFEKSGSVTVNHSRQGVRRLKWTQSGLKYIATDRALKITFTRTPDRKLLCDRHTPGVPSLLSATESKR